MNNFLRIGNAIFNVDKISGFQLEGNHIQVLLGGSEHYLYFDSDDEAKKEFNETIEILMTEVF